MIGKLWKVTKNAAVRNQQPKQLRKNWSQRTKERERDTTVKALEKALKQDKQDERDVIKNINLITSTTTKNYTFYRERSKLIWNVREFWKKRKDMKLWQPRCQPRDWLD